MALLTWLSACATRPQTAYDVVHPGTAPVRNIGNFNEALRCMDDLFIAQGKQDIYITTAGIPDATGLISAGTKEMFITAVSRMSARSNAFHFVDYDPARRAGAVRDGRAAQGIRRAELLRARRDHPARQQRGADLGCCRRLDPGT
jgi:hypothetical protein